MVLTMIGAEIDQHMINRRFPQFPYGHKSIFKTNNYIALL